MIDPIQKYLAQAQLHEALLYRVHQGMRHYREANITWDLELFNQLTPDNQLRLQVAIEDLAKGHLYAVVMGVSQEKFIVSWSAIQDAPMSVADAALGAKYDVRGNSPDVRKRRV